MQTYVFDRSSESVEVEQSSLCGSLSEPGMCSLESASAERPSTTTTGSLSLNAT